MTYIIIMLYIVNDIYNNIYHIVSYIALLLICCFNSKYTG